MNIIPLDKAKEVIADAKRLGAELLCISGGEPFLHPDIISIVQYAAALEFEINLYTSGMTFDANEQPVSVNPTIIEELRGYVTRIIFNVEADNPELYDKIMGTNFNGFSKMKQSIDTCVNAGMTVEAHIVPMHANINNLSNIVEMCYGLNVNRVNILRLVEQGRALENKDDVHLTVEDRCILRRFIDFIKTQPQDKVRIGVPFCSDKSLCKAANEKINIRYDGKVYPCEVFKDDLLNTFVGCQPDNVFSSRLADIYEKSQYLNNIRKVIINYKKSCATDACIGQNKYSSMASTDSSYLGVVIESIRKFNDSETECLFDEGKTKRLDIEYPIDKEVLDELLKIVLNLEDETEIFKYQNEIKKLWSLLIRKSIKCLRYFDIREPFTKSQDKKPIAYGSDDLDNYFNDYIDFELSLYGSVKYYRDHVIHVFRVWLLGIKLLLENNLDYLSKITIEKSFKFNELEKLSIWTLIALTHDLGYPLEKSMEIIDKTKNMMKSFITNPMINMDLSFRGVQINMNDYILRFISSKMIEVDPSTIHFLKQKKEEPAPTGEEPADKQYVARLQPKYYFKLQKSLEHNNHGILSSIIIYKLLLYFLESDYSINEDYYFKEEDTRQFYIRREILRSIASHTCRDIYQLQIRSFSFLLILCDDAQEWGRKSISELYVSNDIKYRLTQLINRLGENETDNECIFVDKYDNVDNKNLKIILSNFRRQSYHYLNIFRDGQDTANRNFDFKRTTEIDRVIEGNHFSYFIKLSINRTKQSKIEISTNVNNGVFDVNEAFIKSLKSAFDKEYIEENCLSEDKKIIKIEFK